MKQKQREKRRRDRKRFQQREQRDARIAKRVTSILVGHPEYHTYAQHFSGSQMNSVLVYNRVLSEAEIKKLTEKGYQYHGTGNII